MDLNCRLLFFEFCRNGDKAEVALDVALRVTELAEGAILGFDGRPDAAQLFFGSIARILPSNIAYSAG